ncbi:MAG: hypothetical protein CMK09_04740 [Ponticaulis sp.]|nr:hypothetical protein [Ponticaulis sp.]|tara:strand:- start:3789 stop:4784 length:996 start_codon:yes stop_codon:yes gene_type:complete
MIRVFLALVLLCSIPTAWAQNCQESPETHAVKIKGMESSGQLNANIAPEIYGNHNFSQELDNGWVFSLSAAKWGWRIAVYDDETDLTAGTPPLRGPNPREIYGWHFRNADNTGPNTGEVNAPQHMRAFVLSSRAAGTSPGPGDGIGWLKIEDFGLSDLEPGEQARMSYLKFNACLSWPKTEADKASERLDFSEVDQEIFGSCGLDLAKYRLEAAIRPRELGGDLDGDDAIDQAAQIVRKSDGAKGLALCRAGTWTEEIGFGDGPASGIVPSLEAWHWVSDPSDLPLSLGGVTLPEADGDILVLERVEKQAVAVYWKDGALQAIDLFRIVTE